MTRRNKVLTLATVAAALALSTEPVLARNIIEICHASPWHHQHRRTLKVGERAARSHLTRHPRDHQGKCRQASLSSSQPIVLHVALKQPHPFSGIGTNMLAESDQEAGNSVNSGLATPLVRTVVGPDWTRMPAPPVTPAGQTPDPAAFYDYMVTHFQRAPDGTPAPWKLTDALTTLNGNHGRGASVILGFFGIPAVYRNANGLTDVADFAAFWIAELKYLHDQGVDMPQYLDLANEPDVAVGSGGDGFISPARYSDLVNQVADSLASFANDPSYAQLAEVRIIGPGVHVMESADQSNGTSLWVSGLSAKAVGRLAAWSAHAWNDNDVGVLAKWASFIDTARARRDIPFLVTEVATVGLNFPGAPLPQNCTALHAPTFDTDGCAASNSSGFGVRVVENVLALANLGASGSLYWLADDKDLQAWGLVKGTRIGDPARPARLALQSLLAPLTSSAGGCTVKTSVVQGGMTALEPAWDPQIEVPGAAFVANDGSAVVVSLVNPTDAPLVQPVAIQGASIPDGTYEGCGYSVDGVKESPVTTLTNGFDASLPANSLLTVRLPITSSGLGGAVRPHRARLWH